MKILVLTNLFPNKIQPGKGVFNRQQFTELAKMCDLKLIAPIPWVPNIGLTSRWGQYAKIASRETIDGIEVYHPRYMVTPKIGRSFYGLSLYLALRRLVEDIQKVFPFDQILATWAYPDAFAGMLLAKRFKKPLLTKVHGSDVNLLTRYFWRRKMIRQAFESSSRIIAVSQALKEKIIRLGVEADKVQLVPNGVNKNIFKPLDKQECRQQLKLPVNQKIVVFIGNLVRIKGIEDLLKAFSHIKEDVSLKIIGEGPLRASLQKESITLGLGSRVDFLGRSSHEQIPLWMNAADVFCLPSWHEGCPNVILEALSCRTPVVATKVGGIPNMIRHGANGLLVEPRDPESLSAAIQQVLEQNQGDKGEGFDSQIMSWEESARSVFKILQES